VAFGKRKAHVGGTRLPIKAATGTVGDPMTEAIRIRLDREDAAALREAAAAARLTVSGYVRALLFSEVAARKGFTVRGIALGASRCATTRPDDEDNNELP
jgi:hypothetical protein